MEELALRSLGPEPLGHPPGVLRDDRVGRIEDVPVAPVVLLELHHPGAAVQIRELEDVAHLGAPPPVDGLVVVAHHDQVRARWRCELLEELVLDGVGVLELVHQDVLEARPVLLQRLGVLAQELDEQEQQISEVHRVRRAEKPLIGAVCTLDGERPVVVGRDTLHVGPASGVLLHVDAPEDIAGIEHRIHPLLAHGPLHQLELVRVVVDDEGAREAHLLRLAPEDGGRGGVEGGDVQLGGPGAEQHPETLAHLPRGLVGEGDCQDPPGGDAPGEHEVGDAAGDDPRLPRAGAGEHEERPVPVKDGLTLGRVEVLEELVGRLERSGPGHRSRTPSHPCDRDSRRSQPCVVAAEVRRAAGGSGWG